MYFCKGYDYGEKVDLSKGNWNSKRKIVGNHAFIRDNKSTINLNRHLKIQRMYGSFFPNLSSIFSEKCAVASNFIF